MIGCFYIKFVQMDKQVIISEQKQTKAIRINSRFITTMINDRTIHSNNQLYSESTIQQELNIQSIFINGKLFNIKKEIESNMLFNMSKKIIRGLRGNTFNAPSID